ncbi:MAG: thioredoxin-like domain-containing protein [Balneolaceae bacterium]|nr:thioredoxin-like domain-containing protein [Balneolaceae bacterium]
MTRFLKSYLAVPILLLIGMAACTQQLEPDPPSAVVEGRITVADSIDASGDYSGIEVTIIKKDSAQAQADTLYHQVTDSSGHFSGMAHFPAPSFYALLIDRNQRRLDQSAIILADDDTVRIEAVLPRVSETLAIQSGEHDALQTFRRIDRAYNRVANYITRTGELKGDSLITELKKWANLYWDVYEDKRGTFASRMAASESIRLFSIIDSEELMNRLRQIRENENLVNLAVEYGTEYLARNEGLDHSLAWLDTLQTLTPDSTAAMNIQQKRINLLYDSARIDQAERRLASFKEQFGDNRAVAGWIESMEYDLNYLSPGDTIPSFSFRYYGREINRDSLMGTPYILEITLLSNRLYQEQYDRTFAIHSIYQNYGIEVITIPLDQSQVTIDGFFEEREKEWPVASADAFDRRELIEKFNIRLVPTRFLVDRNGTIVRKYIGEEYQDVIQGIQTIIQTEEPAS